MKNQIKSIKISPKSAKITPNHFVDEQKVILNGFRMSSEGFRTQKTGFRRRPRIDTPPPVEPWMTQIFSEKNKFSNCV